MANILDYIDWRGDLGIAAVPLCEADALVFSRAAYLPLDGLLGENEGPVPLGELYSRLYGEFERNEKKTLIAGDDALCLKMACAERYSGIGVACYVNRRDEAAEKQFSAVTFVLPDGMIAAYRGTDGTIVGWKEDFNMSFAGAVPAQSEAKEYLERVAGVFGGDIRVTGHSKGGNLAVYASAFCRREVKDRIVAVRSHDGPGFTDDIAESAEYMDIIPRVRSFLPQSSVVGMLMSHREETVIVKSTERALMQHDLYSWRVCRGGFETADELTELGRFVDDTLKQWLKEMPAERRGKMVDGVFRVLSAGGAVNTKDILAGRHSIEMIKEYRRLDEDTRAVIGEALRVLRESASHAERSRKKEKEQKALSLRHE